VPGLHLHFLSQDAQHGGHVLACRPRRVRVALQMISALDLGLPLSEAYLGWDFHRNVEQDLEKAEK
jgi:acetolactate decarboxylase